MCLMCFKRGYRIDYWAWDSCCVFKTPLINSQLFWILRFIVPDCCLRRVKSIWVLKIDKQYTIKLTLALQSTWLKESVRTDYRMLIYVLSGKHCNFLQLTLLFSNAYFSENTPIHASKVHGQYTKSITSFI